MKITITFDDLSEFQKYMSIQSPPNRVPRPDINRVTGESPEEARQRSQETPEVPQPKKNTKVDERPAPEPVKEAAAPDPAVTEDFRIDVRRQLAALNKKCGRNRAAELINELTGKTKLTEVELADLPKLMEAAKEENNAE